MTWVELVEILSGTVSSFFFGILFNMHGKRLWVGTLGGFLSWTAYILFEELTGSEVMSYFLVAIFVTVYSEVMARVVKSPTTAFIIASLIPLIPGSSLYYTMRYALGSNFDLFKSKALSTLELAAALAIGVIIASAVAKIYFNLLRRYRARRAEKRQ